MPQMHCVEQLKDNLMYSRDKSPAHYRAQSKRNKAVIPEHEHNAVPIERPIPGEWVECSICGLVRKRLGMNHLMGTPTDAEGEAE